MSFTRKDVTKTTHTFQNGNQFVAPENTELGMPDVVESSLPFCFAAI